MTGQAKVDARYERLRGSTALVTGGAGFIGSHLAEALLGLAVKVRVIDDLRTGFEKNLPAGVEFIRASILDEGALARATAGCRYVFHQAAMVSVPQSVAEPRECMMVNVVGTERVLSAAKQAGAERVMFAASAAAYGDAAAMPCREDQLPAPASPYGMSKVAGEMLLSCFSRNYGLSTVNLRYMNIFGVRQSPEGPYAGAMIAFYKALSEGRQPTIFGDGKQTRDWTPVANVVHANLLAAASEKKLMGEVVNVGTGRQISLMEVLVELGRAMGVKAEPKFGPVRAGDVRDSVADISRARALLGYEPIVDFAEGVRRMLGAGGSR